MGVAWFDPSVLAEGVVDAVFVVSVSVGVCAHEGPEFEGVVSILCGFGGMGWLVGWYVVGGMKMRYRMGMGMRLVS